MNEITGRPCFEAIRGGGGITSELFYFSVSPLAPSATAQHGRPVISFIGQNSVTNSPDGSELFIVYHIHTDPQNPSRDRQVCIDRTGFREDGSLCVTGPTHTPQPIPSSKE